MGVENIKPSKKVNPISKVEKIRNEVRQNFSDVLSEEERRQEMEENKVKFKIEDEEDKQDGKEKKKKSFEQIKKEMEGRNPSNIYRLVEMLNNSNSEEALELIKGKSEKSTDEEQR